MYIALLCGASRIRPPAVQSEPLTDEYDSMVGIIDSICLLPTIKDVLSAIESAPRLRKGRPGYSVLSMFRAFLAKFLLGHESTQAFIRDLKRSVGLRTVCGLVRGVPHKSTFSRFYAKLAENAAVLESAHSELVNAIRKYRPDFGRKLAVDATDIAAYANRKRQGEKSLENSVPTRCGLGIQDA